VDGGRTRTTVTRLTQDQRIEEISRMLGGSGITDGLRATAREMLSLRRAGAEAKAKGERLSKGESESPVAKPPTTRRPAGIIGRTGRTTK
jgi:hypothetical protein